MDPVYILQLASEHAEAQASLFRGGLLLRSRFDTRTATEIVSNSIEAVTGTMSLRHWHILLNGYSSRTASLVPHDHLHIKQERIFAPRTVMHQHTGQAPAGAVEQRGGAPLVTARRPLLRGFRR
jgi:hypothetical protein